MCNEHLVGYFIDVYQKFLQCSYWHLVRTMQRMNSAQQFCLQKICIKWIDSMIDTAEKAHSKAVIIIPLHSSAQWDWVSNKNIINSLNLYLLCQLNGNCIHQCHLHHHVYTILTDFSWSEFIAAAAAKQSKAALASACKFSPLSLLTPFTYYICANSEPITAAGRLKIKYSWAIFSKVWIWQTKNIIIQKSYIHICWG